MEVAAAVTEAISRRDDRLSLLQAQVGACLAALGKVTTLHLEAEGGGDLTYLQILNDAGRLLSDVHHSQSTSRRELVALNLNKELKDTLSNAPIDGWLFGDNLDDRVKATKNIERSGQALKQSSLKEKAKNLPNI